MHVYCTECINVQNILDCIEKHSSNNENEGICYVGCSCFGCNCFNLEDSMNIEERPKYKKDNN